MITKDDVLKLAKDCGISFFEFSMVASEQQLLAFARTIEKRARDEQRWISVKDKLPKCSKVDNSFGVPVLIYPPYKEDGVSEMTQVFYGCRQSTKPNFYIFGRIVHGVTYWMPLPQAPDAIRATSPESDIEEARRKK